MSPDAGEVESNERSHRAALFAAALSATLRIGLLVFARSTSEDFYITLRFARNIAEGHGFVYNVGGPPVLGTTTPLYTLLLALAFHLHVYPILFGKLLNIATDSLACFGLYRLGRAAGRPMEGALAAIWLAVHPFALTWADSGMESTMVAATGIWIWAFWAERRNVGAWAAAGLLLLLRVDGGLLVAIMAISSLVRDRKIPLAGLALFLAITAPWLIYATRTFGSPIPASVIAKLTVYAYQFPQPFPHVGEFARVTLANPENWLIVAGLALYAIDLAGSARTRTIGVDAALVPPFAWAVIYLGGIAFSKVPMFGWYFVPPLGICCLLAVCGLAPLVRRLSPRLRSFAPAIAFAASAVIVAVTIIRVGASRRTAQAEDQRLRVGIGTWLRETARPTDTVMLEPIGYIGYYSNLNVLDSVGLVSPEVLPFYGANAPLPLHALRVHFQPQWILLRAGERRSLDRYESGSPRAEQLISIYKLERIWRDAKNQHPLFYLYRLQRRAAEPAPGKCRITSSVKRRCAGRKLEFVLLLKNERLEVRQMAGSQHLAGVGADLEFEGTCDELLQHDNKFAGKRVRLTVIASEGELAESEKARIAAIDAIVGKFANVGATVDDLHRERQADKVKENLLLSEQDA